MRLDRLRTACLVCLRGLIDNLVSHDVRSFHEVVHVVDRRSSVLQHLGPSFFVPQILAVERPDRDALSAFNAICLRLGTMHWRQDAATARIASALSLLCH